MHMGAFTWTAAALGALWGALWAVICGVLLMMASGLTALPQAGSGALAGAGCALLILARPPRARRPALLAALAAAGAAALMMMTGFKPFGAALQAQTGAQAAALAAWAALTVWSAHLCLAGFTAGPVRRYLYETFVLRALKGFALVLLTVLVALPFYVMVMTSLKSQQALLLNPLDFSVDLTVPPQTLFRSYIELFTEFRFGEFLVNSAVVSAVTVFTTLLFAVPGAYAAARLRFPGRAFLSRSILLIYMVPAIILVIPLYAVFSQAGLRDSLYGLMIVYPATTIPVALYMLQGYFRGLPFELEESGLIDGLNRIQVIWRITLPLALPALASVSLYVFMIAWNEFLFAFMFLDDLETFTLSRGVVSLNSSEVPRQHLMAGAVVATVPVLALFLWFEKHLVAGLTAGGVKG